MSPRFRGSFGGAACVVALAACYTNRPITQPLEVKEPIRVGFDTPTRLIALYGGDSVRLVDVILLEGHAQRLTNDTLFFVVTDYWTRGDESVGSPRVSSVGGAMVIVPMTTAPQMYVREPARYKAVPIIAVAAVIGVCVTLVAVLLNNHGS